MPPAPEHEPDDWHQRTQPHPWLRDSVIRRVSPHLDEVDKSRSEIPWMLLVLVLLVLAVATFFLFRASTSSTSAVSTPSNVGTVSSPVPILSLPGGTATPSPPPLKYRVQPGDTLSGIAVKFGVTVPALMSTNNLKSNLIRPGDELVIPLPR